MPRTSWKSRNRPGLLRPCSLPPRRRGWSTPSQTRQNITVFAPSDDAFAALPEGTVESLLLPENQDQLVAILTLHVLPRVLASNQLPGPAIHVRTLNEGALLSIAKSVDPVAVTVSASNTANVIAGDIEADNGVVHVIDAVLLP